MYSNIPEHYDTPRLFQLLENTWETYDEPNDMDYWELIDNIESHLTYEYYLKEYYYLTLGVKI